MVIKLDETNIHQRPDGTVDLVIPPEDILAEMERQLATERAFIFFPIFYSPKRIREMKKTIREYKKANGL